jgi:hypothetical protein
MRLSLDHQQRLNLIALMGTVRGNVAEVRMLSKLCERLELDDKEKEAIGYRTATQNGVEMPSWNWDLSLPEREFEVTDAEAHKLRKIIDEWPHFLTATDRKWLFPLLDQLPEAVPEATPARVA